MERPFPDGSDCCHSSWDPEAMDVLTPFLPAATAEFVRLASASCCPVLLTGETGCGKTQVARLVHQLSPRSARPFVRVNCGSIPESLFEREMFGHVRGAFTDAREGAPGYLEASDGGTLFLDEIGEFPQAIQSKLLLVLEEGEFRRLGSVRESRVDVRIIAATNRDVARMVAERVFREDLFYRISVIQYQVPPLRERHELLPSLVAHLLIEHAADRSAAAISPEAMQMIAAHAWPGNIRELENALRAALVFARGGIVRPEHLPETVRLGAQRREVSRYAASDDAVAEEAMIRRALAEEGGNRTRASRRLGMARSTLWAKLQRYGH